MLDYEKDRRTKMMRMLYGLLHKKTKTPEILMTWRTSGVFFLYKRIVCLKRAYCSVHITIEKSHFKNLIVFPVKDCFPTQSMLYSNQQTVQLRTQVAFSPLVPNCLLWFGRIFLDGVDSIKTNDGGRRFCRNHWTIHWKAFSTCFLFSYPLYWLYKRQTFFTDKRRTSVPGA